MKHTFKILIVTLFVGLLSTSCEAYLDVPSDATLSEEVIFSSYKTFQGFVDPCYSMISDANLHDLVIANNIGTESVSNSGASPTTQGLSGDYMWLATGNGRSIWTGFGGQSNPSIEKQGLYQWWPLGSRICNISLKNLPLLTDATQEEKDKIEGQALFFRAYYNFEVARAYGSIPYLDQIYLGDNVRQPRYWTDEVSGKKDCQAVYEKAARDLTKAATLLPIAWETFNTGRITKGAAYSLLAKVLLYAGSPLYEEASKLGGSTVTFDNTEYNKDYMRRAAEAAAEVIKLGVYELTPFVGDDVEEAKSPGGGYRKMFCNISGDVPYSTEVIFKRWIVTNTTGKGLFDNRFGRIYAKHTTLGGGAGGCEFPLLRFMDKFEMKDGTAYKTGNTVDGGYDDNITQFQVNRDPRFDFNYRLHNEQIGTAAGNPNFEGKGKVIDATAVGPFLITKFWYPLVDKPNGVWGKFNYGTPSLRYADLLLIYAEAVFEATGDPDASIGGVLTARQALNLVRTRVSMPDYNPATYATARPAHGELSTDHPFRLAVRNERCVELAYEGHLWFDYRRWKRTHLLDKTLWILDFKTDVATKSTFISASRVALQPYLFDARNYWLPFKTSETQIYAGFPQNPGW